eukprot:378861_1
MSAMSKSILDVLIWSSISIWWFILSPIAIYYVVLYYRVRNLMVIRQRRYQIVIIFTAYCIYLWLIDRPLALLWINETFNKPLTIHIIHFISFPFCFHGIQWCLVWRYWLTYYDIHFADNTQNSEWKTIINSTDSKQNWFLNHMQTYGNLKWVLKRLLCIYIPIVIISSIVQILPWFNYYSQTVATSIDGVLSFLTGICFIIIYKLTPPFKDKFFIKYELKIIIYIWCLEWSLIFIVRALNFVINIDIILLVLLQSWTAIITTAFWTYLCTLWILKKCVTNTQSYKTTFSFSFSSSTALREMSQNISNKPHMDRSPSVATSQKGKALQLYELLANSVGFDLFMTHLANEFSHECLLSFVEMIQYKKLLRLNNDTIEWSDVENDIDSIEFGQNKNKILSFNFPESVPNSSIILREEETIIMLSNKEEKCYKYKIKAFNIFKKYIYNPNNGNCEYEINISYKTRTR